MEILVDKMDVYDLLEKGHFKNHVFNKPNSVKIVFLKLYKLFFKDV